MTRDEKDLRHAETRQAVFVFAKEHPATVGTLAYLWINALGLVDLAVRFWVVYEFNILDFVEVNDFVTAAFRNPVAFAQGVAGVALLAMWAAGVLERRVVRGKEKLAAAKFWATRWNAALHLAIARFIQSPKVVSVFVIVYAFVLPVLFSLVDPETWSPDVKVYVRELPAELEAEYLGTTDKFLFIRTDGHIRVIPHTNVRQIVFK